MAEALIISALFAAHGVFVWWILRVDAREELAYRRWYESPDRIWNQHSEPNQPERGSR